MPCIPINLGNGVTGIVCTRGERAKRCKACGDRASRQCDFGLTARAAGRTCDVHLCERCAVVVGPERDYCPPHARLAAKGEQQQLPLTEETGR
jgi:hypothetical protein